MVLRYREAAPILSSCWSRLAVPEQRVRVARKRQSDRHGQVRSSTPVVWNAFPPSVLNYGISLWEKLSNQPEYEPDRGSTGENSPNTAGLTKQPRRGANTSWHCREVRRGWRCFQDGHCNRSTTRISPISRRLGQPESRLGRNSRSAGG